MKLAAFGFLLAGTLSAQPTCDRACLEGFVDQYMDALIAHKPASLTAAKKLKNTENGQQLELGDGFWRTATAKGTYRLFVADPAAGEVAFMGTMKEADIPVTVALRLRVVNRQISEIETFVVRTGINNSNGAKELEAMGKPDPLFLQAVSPAARVSREDLIKVANQYFSGMEKNDGKGVYPFADDCERVEDGQKTANNPNFLTASAYSTPAPTRAKGKEKEPPPAPTGPQINPAAMSCKAAFETGYYRFVNRVRDRRFVAVDPERGLVFSFVFADHPAGKYRNFKLADSREIAAGPNRPWTWEIAEMFRVEKGKIRRVEALLEQVPYGMLSGWSNWEDGMSSRPRNP